MREVLIPLMLAPAVASILAMFLLRAQYKRFRRDVPALRTSADMEKLKRLVATQMYGALIVYTLIVAPQVVWAYGTYLAECLSWMDMVYFLVIPLVAILLGAHLMRSPTANVLQMRA